MADKKVQDQGLDLDLDALFAAARDDAAQVPSGDFMARILADAEAMQPKPADIAAPVARPQSRGGLVSGLLSAIGGWPSLGGLAAATVAGVWIGFSATPTLLPDGIAGLVGGSSSSDYLAYLDTSYAYLEEDAQ